VHLVNLDAVCCAAQVSCAVDRGHKHSDGKSEVCIWLTPLPHESSSSVLRPASSDCKTSVEEIVTATLPDQNAAGSSSTLPARLDSNLLAQDYDEGPGATCSSQEVFQMMVLDRPAYWEPVVESIIDKCSHVRNERNQYVIDDVLAKSALEIAREIHKMPCPNTLSKVWVNICKTELEMRCARSPV